MSKAVNDGNAPDEPGRGLAGLTTPSPRITDRGIREQSTLLAWLLLFMFGWILVMVLALRFVVTPGTGWANPELKVAAANAVCMLVAYEVNRRGHFLFAAVLTVGAMLAGIIIGTHLSLQGALEPYYASDDVHILSYHLLPLILAALLLPLRWFVVILLFVGAGVLSVPPAHPQVSWTQVLNGPLLYVGAVGFLLLFVAYVTGVTRRRQYRELEWREQRYRSLFEQSPDVIAIVSMDGTIEAINQSGLALFGYTAGELEGQNARTTYANPNDRVVVMSKADREGGLQDEPVRLRKKDGSLMDCVVTSAIRRDSAGRAMGYQSIIRDVTERLRVEEDLRLKGELLDLAHDGIMLVDPGGEIVYANEATAMLTGYPVTALVGMNVRDLNTREGAEQVPTRISKMLQQGHAEFETEWVCSNARRVDVEVRSHTVQSRGRTLFLSVVRDVTRRRADEAELRLRSELLDAAQDAVFLHDLKGRLIYANASVGQLLGYNAGDLASMDARSLEPPEDAFRFRERMSELFVRRSLAYETKHVCKSGELVPVEVRARLIESGGAIYVLSVARDMRFRKAAEAALRESEARYRTLFEQSMDAIYINAADGSSMEANQAWLDLFGYTREELKGLRASDFYADPRERDSFLERMERTGFVADEVRYKRHDGSVFDCQRAVVARRDDAGRLVLFQGVMRDVTARKKALEELRSSEEKYRTLFEQSMDAVAIYSVDGTLLDANPAHLTLFGLTSADIGRQGVLALYVNPADRAEFVALLERDGVVVDQEVRLRKTSGEEMYCVRSAVARRDSDGHIVALQTVTRDITTRKLAEQELRDSEARFRALVEHTGIGTVISRIDGEILDCNDIFPRMLGYTRDEVLHLRVPDIYANPDDRERMLAQALREGSVHDVEVEFRRKDGSSLYVSLNSTLVPRGAETIVVSQFLDITERKSAERELLRSREELLHSAEQLHELTTYLEDARENERTGIARELHDQLGQALTALRMDLDALRRAATCGEVVPIERMDRMAALLDETVNDVRRISSELRPGILDDAGLVAAIEWQLDRFKERSCIESTLEARADDSTLDRPRATALFRVFQELLTNVARHAGAAHVWVVFDRDDGNCILSVSDDGKGITREQADSVTSLGIIGARERLRPLGGRIEFLKRKPKGSTVRVTMPVT